MSQILTSKEDYLFFGKYKHRRVKDVLAVDPSYLKWAKEKCAARFGEDLSKIIDETAVPKKTKSFYSSLDWDDMAEYSGGQEY